MKKILLAFSILISAISCVQAQWFSNGPFGGSIFSDIRVGSDIYVSTAKGIYKSVNGGQNWVFHTLIVPDMFVQSLYFDGTVMYAGLYASLTVNQPLQGIYVSSDTGQTWTHITAVIGTDYVTSIVGVNGKIFALTDGANNEFFTLLTRDKHGLSSRLLIS